MTVIVTILAMATIINFLIAIVAFNEASKIEKILDDIRRR